MFCQVSRMLHVYAPTISNVNKIDTATTGGNLLTKLQLVVICIWKMQHDLWLRIVHFKASALVNGKSLKLKQELYLCCLVHGSRFCMHCLLAIGRILVVYLAIVCCIASNRHQTITWIVKWHTLHYTWNIALVSVSRLCLLLVFHLEQRTVITLQSSVISFFF